MRPKYGYRPHKTEIRPGGNEAVKERRRMRIAKHILYYLSVPAAIVLWLGGYVLLDALIFP